MNKPHHIACPAAMAIIRGAMTLIDLLANPDTVPDADRAHFCHGFAATTAILLLIGPLSIGHGRPDDYQQGARP